MGREAEHEGEVAGYRGYEREWEINWEEMLHEKRVKERGRDGDIKGRMGVYRDRMCMRKRGAQEAINFNLLVKLRKIYEI